MQRLQLVCMFCFFKIISLLFLFSLLNDMLSFWAIDVHRIYERSTRFRPLVGRFQLPLPSFLLIAIFFHLF